MNPDGHGDNVTPMPFNAADKGSPTLGLAGGTPAATAAGSPDDPRMQEALRLLQAFLAIEDPAARAAIVTLADRLVSYDWLRKTGKL